jgi:hypothetical protein
MERDAAKFLMGALVVAALFDMLTHAEGGTSLIGASGKAITNLFAVLTGQKPTA